MYKIKHKQDNTIICMKVKTNIKQFFLGFLENISTNSSKSSGRIYFAYKFT